jgi:WS/DGAT/MGAT family acyltransferase
MARYAYDRLTALDTSFLILEHQTAYMHVASTMTFAAGPLKHEDGGVDADAIKRMIESKLHLIPRYRQKLAWIPIYQHPVWVDDDRFNIDFHVRHISLPRPGNEAQLKRLSALVMEQHLDRRRPLWEIWVVEGLEGDRLALISKVHHCMIDGVSGVDILRVLMSPFEDSEIHDTPSYIPRPAPSGIELTTREALRWANVPLRAARGVGHMITEFGEIRRHALTAARALAGALGGSLRPPSATPLNREVGPHRRFDWLNMDLAELKSIRRALGGSLNDVVLTIVTGAVRRFFTHRQMRPGDLHFRIMAPLSVRTEEEHGSLGNRVSAWIIELPLGETDPIRQLEDISKRTSELKNTKDAVAAEILTQAAEWTPSTLLSLAGRNVSRLLPFNMVVTNVPGPQFPMYMLGAEMEETFPHVPLTEGLGLGIALMSYNGKLCWGFNADYDLVPDLPVFLNHVRETFAQLKELAEQRTAETSALRAVPDPGSAPKDEHAPETHEGNGSAANGSAARHARES